MMALAKVSMKSCATLGARKIKAKKIATKEETVAKAMSCVSTWVLVSFFPYIRELEHQTILSHLS